MSWVFVRAVAFPAFMKCRELDALPTFVEVQQHKPNRLW
jgi:hypothetical protein